MPLQRDRSTRTLRGSRRIRPTVLALEDRLLLSIGGLELTLATDPPAIASQVAAVDPLPIALAQAQAAGLSAWMSGLNHPLVAPALSSLPGAPASLYLDFTGDFTSVYGSYKNITTPAYDQDGDPSTFSDGEIAAIAKVWSYVAEDYAPFNLNVTTVPPINIAHGVTEKVVIGGTGSWTGASYGGLTYVNDFTQSGVANVAFVFSKNLANGDPRDTGDAASHEAGHGFGLEHQSKYSGATKIQEYSTGPGDGTAPLMGNSYSARRSLWWRGPSDVSSTSIQDDMAILAGPTNGFGYRPEPSGGTPATATPLTVQDGTSVASTGLIVTTADRDYYAFTSGPGPVSFTVSVPADTSNLAPRLLLLDAAGATVIASAGPSAGDFSASLTASLPTEGSYRLLVASDGGYGNVGHYAIRGTIVTPSNPDGGSGMSSDGGTGTGSQAVAPEPPASLAAGAVNPYRIDLTWADVPGETGFRVERSTDGLNWIVLGTPGAGVTTYSDLAVLPLTSFAYRVSAIGPGGTSAPSSVAIATTLAVPSPPAAVTGLKMVSRLPRQVVLAWDPGPPGAEGFLVERSANGKTWTVVGHAGAGPGGFADASVKPGKTYFYRVRAANPWGLSAASRVIRVVTPRVPPPLAIRKKAR